MTASWWRRVAGPGEVRVDIRAIAHGWRRSACRAECARSRIAVIQSAPPRGRSISPKTRLTDAAVEELVLVGHMVVERHGLDLEGVTRLQRMPSAAIPLGVGEAWRRRTGTAARRVLKPEGVH